MLKLLERIEADVIQNEYAMVYQRLDDLEHCMRLDATQKNPDLIVRMSTVILKCYLQDSSKVTVDQKRDLSNRIIVHLADIGTIEGYRILSSHLCERALMEPSIHVQAKYLALAGRIVNLFSNLVDREILNKIREQAAEILNCHFLKDSYEVAFGKDIEKKLKSGDLANYLEQAKGLVSIIGPRRVSQLIGLGREKLKTLTRAPLSQSEQAKVCELILAASTSEAQLTSESSKITNSCIEILQKKHAEYLCCFKELFQRLGDNRFNPERVRAFQRNIFELFTRFLSEELLSNNPFFLFKPLQDPNDFILTVFGSAGREEICPFSDLEYLILCQNNNNQYTWQQLAEILNLEVTFAGSQSVVETENQTGFNVPLVNRQRFYVDDANPFNNPELITTPTNLVKRQEERYGTCQLLKYEIPLNYSLLKVRSLAGSEEHPLMTQYQAELNDYLCQKPKPQAPITIGQQKMLHIMGQLIGLFAQHPPFPPTDPEAVVDLKKQFLHPLAVALESLALYYTSVPVKTPEIQKLASQTNTLDIVESLVAIDCLSLESGRIIKDALAAIYTTRVRLHLEYDYACDQALWAVDPEMQEPLLKSQHASLKVFNYIPYYNKHKMWQELKRARTHEMVRPFYKKYMHQVVQTSYKQNEKLENRLEKFNVEIRKVHKLLKYLYQDLLVHPDLQLNLLKFFRSVSSDYAKDNIDELLVRLKAKKNLEHAFNLDVKGVKQILEGYPTNEICVKYLEAQFQLKTLKQARKVAFEDYLMSEEASEIHQEELIRPSYLIGDRELELFAQISGKKFILFCGGTIKELNPGGSELIPILHQRGVYHRLTPTTQVESSLTFQGVNYIQVKSTRTDEISAIHAFKDNASVDLSPHLYDQKYCIESNPNKHLPLHEQEKTKLLQAHSNAITPLYQILSELVKGSEPILRNLAFDAEIFGSSSWAKYFGDVGEEPPLPANIAEILTSPCPFWVDKKVEETHKLVLVPKTINGLPLTLNSLGELIKQPKVGHPTQYRSPWKLAMDEHGEISCYASHWALMTIEPVPATRGKNYVEQQRIITAAGNQYEVPTLLDAAIVILTEHVKSGVRLFSDNPWAFTRCQEKTGKYQLVIGGFSSEGPNIYNFADFFFEKYNRNGMAALRIFGGL